MTRTYAVALTLVIAALMPCRGWSYVWRVPLAIVLLATAFTLFLLDDIYRAARWAIRHWR